MLALGSVSRLRQSHMNKTPFLLLGALSMTGCGHIVAQVFTGGHSGPTIKGSGHVKTEARKVGNFTKIRSEGSVDVVATIGAKSDLKVTADDNLIKLVKTRVDGDTLVVTCEGNYSTKNRIDVVFSVPTLKAASIRGSSDIAINGLKGGDFDASIAGSGDLSATGSVGALSAAIDGSGDIDFAKVNARSGNVSISGSGDIKVRTDGNLSVSINGSGDVTYFGNARVTKSINGSGDIHRG